eukprot:TRINITY_DN1108_c0_g1_i1.p1 TRINITY_DN1108_c0_g1~~TRINITY_DN1108_c0_g1_i1.p1  ORF type:complete len:2115 (+),score=427.14 TRINITY_DN1108_c0_g1_i1:725-6346(+)
MDASALPPWAQMPTSSKVDNKGDLPLDGWAKLAEMYNKPAGKPRAEAPLAAAAAETDEAPKNTRRRRRRGPPMLGKDLPPLEELENASAEDLVDMLGFPEQEAKTFASMNPETRKRVITECRTLLDMSPSERQAAFEQLRKAWPTGPFPSFSQPHTNLFADEHIFKQVLPAGTCFPLRRPQMEGGKKVWVPDGLSHQLAQALSGTQPGTPAAAGDYAAQKKALSELLQPRALAQPVPAAEPLVASDRIDYSRLPADKVDRAKLAVAVISKSKLSSTDVARYLAEEMKVRPVIQDAGPRPRLKAAELNEADYRGERLKILRDTVSQIGNEEVLALTKPNLVVDAHKEYLKAGADICCTNTLHANSIAQRDYKAGKLVTEMNKAAAQLAKKAAAEVTKQDPKKPRFVAGLLGQNKNMLSAGLNTRSFAWDELVESYSEQIQGLLEGGVDLIALESISDAVSAKAAIFAMTQVYQKAKQKCPPVIINALIDASTGRTLGGQTADAFLISVKHVKPLAVGLTTSGSAVLSAPVIDAYKALDGLNLSFCGLKPGLESASQAPAAFASSIMAGLKSTGNLPNIVGAGDAALPTHIAALAQALQSAGTNLRKLPSMPDTPVLQLSGHDAYLSKPNNICLVGQGTSTFAKGKFKSLVDDYRATKQHHKLQEALDFAAAQAEQGADVLDVCLDAFTAEGHPRPGKGVLSRFVEMCDVDTKVGSMPMMICSSEWKATREALRNVQGRCVVNSICLMLGEDEFLRIAKECLRHGAAVVVMAIGEDGRACSSKDKVSVLQRSYRLLRTKLDFPPEDIILDCALQSIRPDEHPIDAINAIAELAKTCPLASLMGGVSNLSMAFDQLGALREALHSVFLQHAIPKGLNMVLGAPGRLPVYSSLESEMKVRCEDVVLRSTNSNEGPLQRFLGYFGFRSGALVCLPIQKSQPADDKDWDSPECKLAAADAQREFLDKRGLLHAPDVQKTALQALKAMGAVSSGSQVRPDSDCARPEPCRVTGSGGAAALQQQVSTALSSRTAPPGDSLLGQLNADLQRKVLLLDGLGGPADQLYSVKDAASFQAGSRFPASAVGNLGLLAVTKPDLVLDAHRALLKAGVDIIRTATRHGDGVSQRKYGTEEATYELNKAAATVAKQATSEAVSENPAKLKYVAGVMGAITVRLSSASAIAPEATWDELVGAYLQQVRGLMDGGVDLLMLDEVSDTLTAKAAIYAVEEHFAISSSQRPPMLINVVLESGGLTPSGQRLPACIASLRHAKPLAFGVMGAGAEEAMEELSQRNPCWSLLTGDGSFVTKPASSGLVNLVSAASGSLKDIQQHVSAFASKATPPRALPAPAPSSLLLSGKEAIIAGPDGGVRLIGQRCNLQGSARFRSLMDAYKYSGQEDCWEAAVELCAQQVEAQADLLDFNLDCPTIDSRWAMGKLVRLCASHPTVSQKPFMISSMSWAVISEGLKSTQGKCIVNGICPAMSEEGFLRLANECMRFGAAVVVVAIGKADGEFPSYQEKVSCCQRAYQLLRSKLDFPAEDIIFDCVLTPLGCAGVKSGLRDFVDAVAEVKRTCPGVSFMSGVSNITLGFKSANMLRQAVHSAFLQHAVPLGLNLALVEVGRIPVYNRLEEPTKGMIDDVLSGQSADGQEVHRLLTFAAYVSGGSALESQKNRKLAAISDIPEVKPDKESALAPLIPAKQQIAEPIRPTAQWTHPIETLVQATGTINSSIFQAFGSKAHAAANYHRLIHASTVNKTVHFSSISVYMGQGGSGPITGASAIMDGITLWERHQGVNQYACTVLWGAIGEIGLRKAIYGSRDVFAQFDLGQKLIGPADTAFLMRQVCCNFNSWDFIGEAYLDQTWKGTLSGAGGTGLSGRKTFLDND